MTWYASQMRRNQRAQSLPRIKNTPPIIARSRTSRTHTTSYSKGRCALNSVRWYANPMAPAITNMQPMTVTELGRLFISASNSQEDFSAIHPKQNSPVNDQHAPADEQRLVCIAEDFEAVLAQMSLQCGGGKSVEQLGDAVGGDRIHPDDDQRERPPLHSLQVNQRIEPRRQQKTPAAAEQHPTRRPDALHDGANAQAPDQPTADQTDQACDHEPFHFAQRIALTAEHIARDQSKDHRSERRDEAERRIPAAVERERSFTREKIQEPHVESPRQIRVLVPMRGETAHPMRPVFRHADGRRIEIRRG